MRPIEIGQLILAGIALVGMFVLIGIGVEVPDWVQPVLYTIIAREALGLGAGRVRGGALVRQQVKFLPLLFLVSVACDTSAARCDNLAKAVAAAETEVVNHDALCPTLDDEKQRTCNRALAATRTALEAMQRAYEIECSGDDG